MIFSLEANKTRITLEAGESKTILYKIKQHFVYNPMVDKLRDHMMLEPEEDLDVDYNNAAQLMEMAKTCVQLNLKELADHFAYYYNRAKGKNHSQALYNPFWFFGDSTIYRGITKELPGERSIVSRMNGDNILIPIGWTRAVYEFVKEHYRSCLHKNCFVSKNPRLHVNADRKYHFENFGLRPYQIPLLNDLLDAIEHPSGAYLNRFLLDLAVGWGKTYLMGGIIMNIDDANFLLPSVRKTELLKNIADFFFDLKFDEIGVLWSKQEIRNIFKILYKEMRIREVKSELGDRYVNKDEFKALVDAKDTPVRKKQFKAEFDRRIKPNEFCRITFGMTKTIVNRLQKKEYMPKDLRFFNCVLVDEVHQNNTPTCEKLMANLRLGGLVGLTGTPFTSPDHTQHVKLINNYGPAFASENIQLGIERQAIVPFEVEVYVNENNDPSIYNRFPNAETHVYKSKPRNQVLLQILKDNVGAKKFIYGGSCLIDYLDYTYKFLNHHTADIGTLDIITGRHAKDSVEEEAKLSGFKIGDTENLITNRKITTAQNFNSATVFVVWYAGINKTFLEQALGRVLRPNEDHSTVKVILIEDKHAGKFTDNFPRRLKTITDLQPNTKVTYITTAA